MKIDVGNAVLESLLERPEEWEFDTGATRKYITHRASGFELAFYGSSVDVFSPDWARLHKFKGDTAQLIHNAILLLKKEWEEGNVADVENRILKMVELKPKPKPKSKLTCSSPFSAALYGVAALAFVPAAGYLLFRLLGWLSG